MSEVVQQIFSAILEGDKDKAAESVETALTDGLSPTRVLEDGLIAAMSEVGRRFEAGEFYVPEMLVSARAMQAGLARLKPQLIQAAVKPLGRIAIGTVKGDLHEIGKNLVGMMLEGAGFEIQDLGVDVPPDTFVQAAREGACIVAISALLTTTMSSMQDTVAALEAAGLRPRVRVMVGGAPVTQTFADRIGADGFAPDASQAVALARRLIQA